MVHEPVLDILWPCIFALLLKRLHDLRGREVAVPVQVQLEEVRFFNGTEGVSYTKVRHNRLCAVRHERCGLAFRLQSIRDLLVKQLGKRARILDNGFDVFDPLVRRLQRSIVGKIHGDLKRNGCGLSRLLRLLLPLRLLLLRTLLDDDLLLLRGNSLDRRSGKAASIRINIVRIQDVDVVGHDGELQAEGGLDPLLNRVREQSHGHARHLHVDFEHGSAQFPAEMAIWVCSQHVALAVPDRRQGALVLHARVVLRLAIGLAVVVEDFDHIEGPGRVLGNDLALNVRALGGFRAQHRR
jgi:hypothetical protein